MDPGPVLQRILDKVHAGARSHWVLLDPDDFTTDQASDIAAASRDIGVDALLIGGSLLHSNHFDHFVTAVKDAGGLPVILFPGDATQLSASADAVLFLSLVSGRNPVNLIGEQVKGAPVIKQLGIEPLSTAYMLVESGSVSSVEFMSNTHPLPRNKPMIAAAHALAAQYMGMSLVYLEAGSGAPQSVPAAMIESVRRYIDIPIIVGGGIRDADAAKEKIDAGADIIVTGNLCKRDDHLQRLEAIADVVHAD
jgi:phosphoglycerol geranylgeranyltransferase